jgi:xanthine dehydrogenase YagT iron-sulfur-binding subunit
MIPGDYQTDRSQVDNPSEFGRREFLKGSVAVAASVAVAVADDRKGVSGIDMPLTTARSISLTLSINDQRQTCSIDPRTTLLDLLRENLGLTGTKKGCDHGACGACTVHLGGERILSCLTLAATLEGTDIKTIEGLAIGEDLHPLQEAFLQCDAFQCGYCTPGQIMSGVACIREGHAGGEVEETREWMSGNLCRCSAYPNIVDAVRQAAAAAG